MTPIDCILKQYTSDTIFSFHQPLQIAQVPPTLPGGYGPGMQAQPMPQQQMPQQQMHRQTSQGPPHTTPGTPPISAMTPATAPSGGPPLQTQESYGEQRYHFNNRNGKNIFIDPWINLLRQLHWTQSLLI